MNSSNLQRSGILFVLSAPSGAGKTTLCRRLRGASDFVYAVSCTTRASRKEETNGVDYHFLSRAEFDRKIAAGEFLEHAEVHNHLYGTLLEPVLHSLRAGRDLLLDIDILGAEKIRSCGIPEILDALADIFLLPPGMEELRRRLEARGTETEQEIETRLENASRELESWSEYRYLIPGKSIEENLETFLSIVRAERSLARRFQTVSQ